MPAESSSPKELSCPCADTFSFCDTFENKCVPCQDICQNQNTFADCQKDCPQYLQSVIFRHTVEKDDLQTLTIMVALTAAMTCVVMLAVFVLISMKLKKLRRLKKKIMPTSVFTVEKGKVEIDIPANDTVSDNLVIKGSASHIPTQMRPSSLQPGTSMSTMVTQLSQESSIHLPSTDTAITGVTSKFQVAIFSILTILLFRFKKYFWKIWKTTQKTSFRRLYSRSGWKM